MRRPKTAPRDRPTGREPVRATPIAVPDDPPSRAFWLAAAVIAIVALLLRLLTARGDFWADEIWSLDLAKEARTPWEILSLHSDNNHVLNTLVLYVLRDQPSMFVARLHSVIAGAMTVILAGVFSLRWGRPAAMFAMALTGASHVLVHYSSEARGYSMLVCFFLAALIALDRGLDRPSWRTAIIFWICCILGSLSHSLFLQGYLAMLAWSAWRMMQSGESWKICLRVQLMYHAVPAVVIGVLYFTFIRHLLVAGASVSPPWDILCDTAAFTLGMPRGGAWGATALALVACVLIAGTALLWRTRRDEAVLMISATVIAPALIVLLSSPAFLLARYFIIPIAMAQILLGMLLGRLWNAGASGRIAALIGLGLVLAGNSLDIRLLLLHGRGSYFAALHYIEQHTAGPLMRIGGDQDLRQATIVRFYSPLLTGGKQIEYVQSKQVAVESPEWVLLHRWGDQPPPGESLTFDFTHMYALRASYPASPLGGWKCFVYQREVATTQPAQ